MGADGYAGRVNANMIERCHVPDTGPKSAHSNPDRHPQLWYPESELAILNRILDDYQVRRAPGMNVEVGSWTGQSAMLISEKLGPLSCVDPWGDMTYADRPDLTAGYSYPIFCENTKHLPITRFRCGWEEFFEVFDGPLAFLHIDAVHEYDHVKGNIDAALPYLSSGGVLCGHDWTSWFPGVEEAVRECLGDVFHEERVWWWTKP